MVNGTVAGYGLNALECTVCDGTGKLLRDSCPLCDGPSADTNIPILEKDSNAKYTRQGNPKLGRLTGREKEFEELGDLTSLYEGLSAKTRQHVNPLADHFQIPTPAPDWSEVFEDPTLPLQIDVGCGSGRFVLIRAQRMAGLSESVDADLAAAELDTSTLNSSASSGGKPIANVLGMEIRKKLVERSQEWTRRLKLRNCGFIFTNATVSWRSLLDSYPGPIELVSMQFPDPHFKARHHKRRHVQPQLVREMAQTLQPGARVFLQGDVPEAVRWMRDMIEAYADGSFALANECQNRTDLIRAEWETRLGGKSGNAADVDGDAEDTDAKQQNLEDPEQRPLPLEWSANLKAGWLPENPLGVPSEREVYVSQINATVYRLMLVRV